MLKSIRCGRGLGDSLYLQSVVRHLVRKRNEGMVVASDYPDVFLPLRERVKVKPFTRSVDIIAHYATRKGLRGTSQFKDCCTSAGINETVEFAIDWEPINAGIIDRVRAPGRPILVVPLPRTPMGRKDGFGAELLPDCTVLQRVINAMRETHTVVQVGAGKPLFEFQHVDIDLANSTSVADMIDVASVADRFVGYCSFLVPLAESFQRPALFVWSQRGLRSPFPYIQQITPEKILQRTSRALLDQAPLADVMAAIDEFRRDQ